MDRFLGIDIGGTAARWVMADANGTVLARGSAPGATGHLFNPAERERLRATLAAIAADVPPGSVTAACLGITGLGLSVHAEAQGLAGELFGLSPTAIRLCDDMELAFRAAFAPGQGHLISAGTGSIGLHLDADGAMLRVGGRGLLIDDGGSGTWIALTALDQLYRRIDQTGGPGEAAILAQSLFTAMGGEDWDHTRAFVYGSDRGRIGTLAQAVAQAATAGDPLALDILGQAAAELARLAKALIGRVGPLPVAFVGGITTLHPAIKAGLAQALPDISISFPPIDAAVHAAQWARTAPQHQATS
ncbi:MAG: ATPase BadF/BadG/BcrA/BcrD type [Devosia sp.]|jgi:glucosamine kinase|nr:ATPase BadF/BadG/BcrA/BcrD type [Devosia sp.]